MRDWGTLTVTAHYGAGGLVVDRLEVVDCDGLVGISTSLLADSSGRLIVDPVGNLLVVGNPDHRYTPVRFSSSTGVDYAGGSADVLVCSCTCGGRQPRQAAGQPALAGAGLAALHAAGHAAAAAASEPTTKETP